MLKEIKLMDLLLNKIN